MKPGGCVAVCCIIWCQSPLILTACQACYRIIVEPDTSEPSSRALSRVLLLLLVGSWAQDGGDEGGTPSAHIPCDLPAVPEPPTPSPGPPFPRGVMRQTNNPKSGCISLQCFVYQKWPDQIFPMANFVFSPTVVTLVWTGGDDHMTIPAQTG